MDSPQTVMTTRASAVAKTSSSPPFLMTFPTLGVADKFLNFLPWNDLYETKSIVMTHILSLCVQFRFDPRFLLTRIIEIWDSFHMLDAVAMQLGNAIVMWPLCKLFS